MAHPFEKESRTPLNSKARPTGQARKKQSQPPHHLKTKPERVRHPCKMKKAKSKSPPLHTPEGWGTRSRKKQSQNPTRETDVRATRPEKSREEKVPTRQRIDGRRNWYP